MKYSQEQLEAAFTALHDPNDWKAPICASVQGEHVMLAVRAIEHFTATTPTVTMRQTPSHGITYLLESIGYRNGPAGPGCEAQ